VPARGGPSGGGECSHLGRSVDGSRHDLCLRAGRRAAGGGVAVGDVQQHAEGSCCADRVAGPRSVERMDRHPFRVGRLTLHGE